MYDAASVNATSTSVSLLYRERPVLNFAAYVSRMEEALRATFEDTLQLTWDQDDLVVIDIDGSRVLLGYWEAPAESAEGFRAVLVLSVGPGPDWRSQPRLARHRKSLCQSVIAGILERNPADMVLWKDFQGVFTPEDFDMLVEQAVNMGEQEFADAVAGFPADDALGADRIETLPEAETVTDEPGDERFGNLPVRRLMDRLETEIRPSRPQVEIASAPATPGESPARRRSRRPADWRAEWEAAVMALPDPDAPEEPEAIATNPLHRIANDLPDLPLPQASELERIRAALYPEQQEEERGSSDRLPLAQRLTIYTVNTTLMLVALPVGAALMTYNILGGEDFKTTARAVALTGAAIGLAHSTVGQFVLSLV